MTPSRKGDRNAAGIVVDVRTSRRARVGPAPVRGLLPMTVIDRSAIDALHRMEQVRKAREDRMRNALEILASPDTRKRHSSLAFPRFVRATAREGLGRDEPTNQEG